MLSCVERLVEVSLVHRLIRISRENVQAPHLDYKVSTPSILWVSSISIAEVGEGGGTTACVLAVLTRGC